MEIAKAIEVGMMFSWFFFILGNGRVSGHQDVLKPDPG